MLPEKIMQSDLLDILFDNRNKTYGAYPLRRSYNKRLGAAISITFFIVTAFTVFQFMRPEREIMYVKSVISAPDPELTKINPLKPQPENPVPHTATHFNQKIYSTPVIAKDNTETQTPTVDDLNKNNVGDVNIIGDNINDMIQPPADIYEGSVTTATQPAEIKEDDVPLNQAQVMPEYPGGVEALKKFMLRNLRQPDNLQPGEKIIIKAFFIVDKTGKIEQVKIINAGRYDLDKEVERVINKMPLWKPGMQNGNTVAVYFNLPVTFLGGEE